MTALVFGEVDPKDYMEPLCGCGHVESEHYDGNGSPPGEPGGMAPCWYGWDGDTEGCQCLGWSAPGEATR